MIHDPQGKIKSQHLRRNAYLYVRQSSLRQVMENTESTDRQYALRQRAIQLGWAQEQIVVIDNDLGQSGATAADRLGFQNLVAEVGTDRKCSDPRCRAQEKSSARRSCPAARNCAVW